MTDSKLATSGTARPRSCAAATIAPASGCSLAYSRPLARRSSPASSNGGSICDRGEARLPFRQRAGLVDDQGIDLLEPLERLGILDQHSGARATAHPDHDGHRRGEAEGARAGDDQHRDGADQRVSEARLGSPQRPGDERQRGNGNHRRHEERGDAIGQFLDWRACALRFTDHPDNACEQGVAAHPLGTHGEAASAVEGRSRQAGAGDLLDRDGLAGDERFIDGTTTVHHDSVDRDLLAGTDAQQVADSHVGDRHVHFVTVTDCARGVRGHAEQRADRGAGPAARTQLEHLAEQHQHGDDNRGVEVGLDDAMDAGSPPGKIAGATVAATLNR